MEPVLIRGVPSLFKDIGKLCKAAPDVIEHTVKDHADPRRMQRIAHLFEVLIGTQPAVDLFIVPRVVSVRIRLKYRAEIDSRDAKFGEVRDPFLHFQDPVRLHAVIFIRRAAHSERIDLIDHTFFSPHSSFPPYHAMGSPIITFFSFLQ